MEFDEEFIGGKSFGNICSKFRGAKVSVDDIFNVDKWTTHLKERDAHSKDIGWSRKNQERFNPNFDNSELWSSEVNSQIDENDQH